MGEKMGATPDKVIRDRIMRTFYDAYLEHGLNIVLMAGEVAAQLGIDEPAQARRNFDYLAAKQLIRPMTLGGGYAPTVQLVDLMEQGGRRRRA